MRHALQEKTRKTPTRLAEAIQQRDQPDPVCGRTIHSPPESMADTIYPLQAPPTHNYSGNQRDTEDNVLPTTSRTMFPQQLNKLQPLRKAIIGNLGEAVKNLQEALHQLPEEFDGSNIAQLPSNLQECTDEIKIRDIREFIEQEGIPLYAIPRDRDAVLKLLEAKDRQGRRQILGEFCQSLVVDCAVILKQARNTVINDLRGFIEDGIATMHAGHYYAAQALFTVILDTLISYFYPDQENRRKIIGHQRSASVPDEIKAMEIRDALVWLPIWHAHEQFWASRGDSIPNDRYSRHASVHAVSVDQYNKENCIQVMMLVASLIAYAEQIDS